MDIRVLEYYLMVAREENITKAAALLHITQPTLSRQLIQLEQELGVKLFTRSSHNIILTNEGLMLKRRAQELVALSERTKRDMIKGEPELSGEIAIGSGEFLGVALLSEMMSAFKKAHPLITYKFFSGNSSIIKERIESGLLDIGLIFDYVDISRYEYVRLPIQEEWGFLVKEDSILAEKKAIIPADVKNLPLIISERSLRDNSLTSWLGENLDDLNIVATYNLMYNAAVMVANGMGTACCIKLDCRYDRTFFVPTLPLVTNSAVLAWKKTFSQSPNVDAFIEFSKKYIKSISSYRI